MGFVEFLAKATSSLNGFVIQLFICELLFAVPFRLRPHARVLVPAGLILYFAVGWVVRYIPRMGLFTASVYCIIVFAVSVGVQQMCFDRSLKRNLFNSSAAYILQNLTLNICEVLTMPVPERNVAVAVRIPISLAVYALYFFVLMRGTLGREIKINNINVVIISFISVLLSNVCFTLISAHGFSREQLFYVKLLFIICCNLALVSQFALVRNASLTSEKTMIEQLLVIEQKQHKMTQENIDLINIKCHDLKKQLALLRKCVQSGNADDMFMDVENAVLVYDESVKTGNDNLDLVFTEKQLWCAKNKIRFEIMADGGKLSFMSATDIYSLFGNALDNAIEGVIGLGEDERVISVGILQRGNYVTVSISNPCSGRVVLKNGVPQTSKDDIRYHGFGTRSMKYIVEKYGGNIVFSEKDGVFGVYIIFPLSDKTSAA